MAKKGREIAQSTDAPRMLDDFGTEQRGHIVQQSVRRRSCAERAGRMLGLPMRKSDNP